MRLLIIYIRYLSKRLLFALYFGFFVYLYFYLNKAEFDLYVYQLVNPFYGYFSEQTLFIYIVNITIIAGLSSTLLEFILAYFNSSAKRAIEKRKIYIHHIINSTFFDHLTNKHTMEDDMLYAKAIKRKFVTDYPRLVFINRLRRVMMLSTGEARERCIRIFNFLHAEPLIWAYIHSPYQRHKLFALKLVGEFKLTRFDKRVRRLMHKKNIDICSEAMYAYIKINSNTNFHFLIERNKPISKLDFYIFTQIAANYKNIDCRALITCEIVSISALGIRFVSIMGDTSLKNEIKKRLDHENETIKEEAQYAFLNLLDENDVRLVFEKFDDFLLKNQLSIIQIFADHTDNKLVLRFYDAIIENYNIKLKLKAMSMILKYNMIAFMKYKSHADEEVRNAYKQLTDYNL